MSPFTTEESIRYVALGDSFTEGVGDIDENRPNGVRGWADRVAEEFMQADPEALYANLAIRGRLLIPILEEQLEAAIDLKPNLVSLYGGGNDMLRPSVDIDALMDRLSDGFAALRKENIHVFTFTGMDVRDFNAFKQTRPRTALYNELLREIADEHGVTIVDFWRMRDFSDPRLWSSDRLHMNPLGHTKMARRVLKTLSVENVQTEDLHLPWAVRPNRMQLVREQARWTREFVVPWVGRRLRGTSSGDGLSPKYPELTRFDLVE